MDRSSLFAAVVTAVAITTAGCSSGGGSPTPAPAPAPAPAPGPPPPPAASPSIQVLPAVYDFGTLTPPNSVAPLQVTISNTGNAPMTVSGITLSTPSGPPYALAVGGGVKPCGSATPTIAANDLCTVQVVFQPTTAGTFASMLQIASNASNAQTVTLPITGRFEQVVSTLNVRINQLDTSCSAVPNATAYVSVTDQAGFPVSNLTSANFVLTELNTAPSLTINSVNLVESVGAPVAISALMDHSGSLTDLPVAFAEMKAGFVSLFADLRSGDLAEIVKFDDVVTVAQPFTSDKALLQAKAAEPYDMGRNTSLYDAVFRGVDDAAAQTTATRRAVIVTTDGMDTSSTRTFSQATNNAVTKKVPVFAIGLGASINRTMLQEMTTTTGGQYYEANTSQNLATIYDQLSSVLFQKQYVITFNHAAKGAPSTPYQLNIGATLGAATGNATKLTNTCN